jgi:hypothetical protein
MSDYAKPFWFCLLLALILGYDTDGHAQNLVQLLELEKPGHLTLNLFTTGYGAEKYGATHEGFELDQTVTSAVGLVGRATAYQIYQGTGFDSPLIPAHRSAPRDFGLLEGGIRFLAFQGTTFTLMGGEDVGDSHAPVFENDFSSWQLVQSRHPINFAYSTSHYSENGVTNGMIDLRMVVLSTGRLLLLLGGGGAIWGGGSVGQAKGQGGADVGVFLRHWRLSVDLQAGYGSSHTYGIVGLSRSFGWDE